MSTSKKRQTALDMIANSDDYSAAEMIEILAEADDLYANESESFIEDNEYDALRLIASRLDPSNVYFTGVGSDVRGGKVKLPFEMGSLNQVEIGDIEAWIIKHELEDEMLCITDKMDGTSALLIYDDYGDPQIAYSRGNGTEGADISRHIFRIANVPQKVSGRLVVRAEVELSETTFKLLRSKVTKRDGSQYKNARNMVAGLMNSKTNPDIVYDKLTVIAYEIIDSDDHKGDQLSKLEFDEGFTVVEEHLVYGYELNDAYLADYLNQRREEQDFAIDGLVIDVDSAKKRAAMNPTRDTLNPEYSIKYKVADEDNLAITTVKGITWNVSKHGYLKPQVNIEPVELVGVTVSNATGFNAKYVQDNGIGPGAKIKITRSGDVIPFILEVVESVEPQMPEEACDWNETDVDLVLRNKHRSDTVRLNQLVDFFVKIEAPMLKEGSIKKLFEHGYLDYADIIVAEEEDLVRILGENGHKIYDGLRKRLSDIPAYKLLGALSEERGLGVRKFKKLQQAFGQNALISNELTREQINAVDGFEEKTTKKALVVMNAFGHFLDTIDGYYTFEAEVDTSAGSLNGEKVVFTGFRDAELGIAVEKAGGEMKSGVSKTTTILVCKDPTSNSGKVKKARDLGVRILGIDEIKELV